MKLLAHPDQTPLVIRVRYYGGNLYVATAPNQGVYRSASGEQGFDHAAAALLERHFPGQPDKVDPIPHNDARVAALNVKPDRNDADTKGTRWFIAHVAIAD